MTTFHEVLPDIHLLKIPFGPVWTGVILIKGESNILIDSGATGDDVDKYIIPALHSLGITIENIDYLVNTHSHGDHIGGNFRLRQLGDFQVAAFEAMAPKIMDPVPYAIQTRTRFPEYSPAPQSQLQGIPVDVILKDGEILAQRLQVIHTPGHDNDCVCWYDLKTKTIITGDSLQANGTICQGVGFYKSLPDYLWTLQRLENMEINNILCGHDYEGIGYLMTGKKQVKEALRVCNEFVEKYNSFIITQKNIGCEDPAMIAEQLIRKLGCGMPERLFMALYTVTEHLNTLERGN